MLTETLRLYPSVPVDGRETRKHEVLPSGIKVEPGVALVYSAYVMGRLLYKDPETFDPDRWLPEREKGNNVCSTAFQCVVCLFASLTILSDDALDLPAGQFTAFHLGPQTCLGKEMAYLEAATGLTMCLMKYRFRMVPGQACVKPEEFYSPSIILGPKGGIEVFVESCDSAN